jgi:hypothetical protein
MAQLRSRVDAVDHPFLVLRLRLVVLKLVGLELIVLRWLGPNWCCGKQSAECR